MKRLLFSALVFTALASACNNEKKPDELTLTDEDGDKTTVEVTPMAQAAEAMQKKAAELQQLTPYTIDEMKAMLPEDLGGVKRSSFKTSSMMGITTAEATYKLTDTSEVELKLYDCAGQAGAGFYSMQFLPLLNIQSESDDEYTRTVDFKGGKAIEQVEKEDNDSKLTWVAKERLMILLEGKRIPIDALKGLAGKLPY